MFQHLSCYLVSSKLSVISLASVSLLVSAFIGISFIPVPCICHIIQIFLIFYDICMPCFCKCIFIWVDGVYVFSFIQHIVAKVKWLIRVCTFWVRRISVKNRGWLCLEFCLRIDLTICPFSTGQEMGVVCSRSALLINFHLSVVNHRNPQWSWNSPLRRSILLFLLLSLVSTKLNLLSVIGDEEFDYSCSALHNFHSNNNYNL